MQMKVGRRSVQHAIKSTPLHRAFHDLRGSMYHVRRPLDMTHIQRWISLEDIWEMGILFAVTCHRLRP
eukprot:4573400-Amphidinium_carterae.1